MDATTYLDPSTEAPRAGAPLGMLLSARAAAMPTRPALTMGGETIDFASLDGRANRRARQFLAMRVEPEHRVMLAMPNCIEYFEAAYACWKIGATPCPVSHRLPPEEFDAIADLLSPYLLFGEATAPAGVLHLHPATEPDPTFADTPMPPAISSPGKIATSGGSTGRPKAIVDPLPSVWGPDKEAVRRRPGMRVLNPGPLYHSAPFNMMSLALAQGCHVISMDRFDPAEWLALIERHRIEWAYLVPTMMARIARLPSELTAAADLSSLKTVLHMAAPCPPDIKRWWIERLGPDAVWEVYGGTERVGVTIIGGADWLAHPGSVGRAATGQQILILDQSGGELPSGTIGEIYFRKSAAAPSSYAYIGADSRSHGGAQSFGDMGWLDEDGWLYIADRRTDMVLVGGVNVYPAEIEAVVETMPGVVGCAIIGLPDPDMGSRLHGIVQLHEDAPVPDSADFLAAFAESLAPLKRPRSVEFVLTPLRDDAGKMRRSALRDARLGLSPRSESTA